MHGTINASVIVHAIHWLSMVGFVVVFLWTCVIFAIYVRWDVVGFCITCNWKYIVVV